MSRYYYLIGFTRHDTATTKNYPIGVAYNPLDERTPISIWEGYPWENLGSCVSPRDVLQSPRILRHFELADANWFLPVLQRMARGEAVSIDEIRAMHLQCRGKPMREGDNTGALTAE